MRVTRIENCCWILGWQRIGTKTFSQRRMMRLPAGGDQRIDPGRAACRDIRGTEIASIRQQRIHFSQCIRQRIELIQNGFDLLLVIACPRHTGRGHQQTARRDGGLGVVALFEAAPGDRHDA